jgi:hypothetical protein
MRHFSKSKFQNLKWSLIELDLLYQEFRNVPEHKKAELITKMQKLEAVFNEIENILAHLDSRGKCYNELVADIKTNVLGKNLKDLKNQVPVESETYRHFINCANFLKKT